MDKKDVDILVNNIRNIILNKPIKNKLGSESQELLELEEAISYLSNCLSESNQFLKQLAVGNLDAKTPSRHNFLSGSLKELHSALKHLTWQANQVASGDYNQNISFLGDFSVSFNKMIAQLQERESQLKQQSNVLSETNDFMLSIMNGLKDWIVVTCRETGEIIYANQSAKQLLYNPDTKQHVCGEACKLVDLLKQYKHENNEDATFDYRCPYSNKVMRTRTFLIQWNNTLSYVHYIIDITSEKEERKQIEELAYKDELTKLYNRRYCIGQLDHLLMHQIDFSFCMIDIDGLKFANDNFGHAAGDEYLKAVTKEILEVTRSADIACRFGGDEFSIIFTSCPADIVIDRMNCINEALNKVNKKYPMSISYGVVYVEKGEKLLPENIMVQADERMYIQKMNRKKNRI